MTVAPSNGTSAFKPARWIGLLAVPLLALAVLASTASRAGAEATWGEYPLPRKAGGFSDLPLGQPSDINCWSASRCLLTTGGDPRSFPSGVFIFNGDKQGAAGGWRQYSTLCSGAGSNDGTSRVVWAGPTEFWLITTPSDPYDTAGSNGLGLCHVKDGAIVGSYSTLRSIIDSSSDPFRKMEAGACRAADDCWFGGVAAVRPDGTDPGTFHLHWDGTKLTSVYAPARRGASDITATEDGFAESVFPGPDANSLSNPALIGVPAYQPIQKIAAGGVDESAFSSDTLLPSAPGFPVDATAVLALDNGLPSAPGPLLWAVGGGATSGPTKTDDETPVDTGPFAAFRDSAGGGWQQLAVDPLGFSVDTRFVDVAAIPGTRKAIAALMPDNQSLVYGDASGIAVLDADAGTVTMQVLGFAGSVVRVECVDAGNCWAATAEGYLLRLRDPATPVAIDSDVAFAGSLTYRPNEVAEQELSDSANDDSQLFAPGPDAEPEVQKPPKVLKAAVGKVHTKLKGKRLIFTFKTIRKVRVTVTAKRRGKVVAETRSPLLRPGRHTLVLKLSAKRWPTKIAMSVKEPKSKTAAAISGLCIPGRDCA